MAQARQVQLPKMLRNPIVALEIAADLAEFADVVEKQHAEAGTPLRGKGRVTRLRAVSKQLAREAEARIGDQGEAE